MKLKSVLDEAGFEALDAALQAHYVEKDGSYILDIDGLNDHPDVKALKTAHDKSKGRAAAIKALNDEITALKNKLEAVPEDFDAEKWASLKAMEEELEAELNDPNRDKNKDKNDREAVAARKLLEQKLVSLEKKKNDEITKLQQKIEKHTAYITKLLVDDGLTKALVEGGVNPTLMRAAKALLRENVSVEENDGEFTAIVKTSDSGELEVGKFVSDWLASDEGKPFITPAKGGDAGGGNGGRNGGGGSKEPNPWAKETWNLTEQGAIMRADRAKAIRLAKVHGHTIAP